ncbi:MAG: transposase [Akkermansiaceae bacterium]|nr:transposase [Akkermansiaceae bacterium]MCP5549501.1 transposase [Akkermansiaceae bacterium]
MSIRKPSQPSSVYRRQNEAIRVIFERAASPRKVLCVALYFAKQQHVSLLCDGNGDVLKKAFPVINSNEGLAFLIDQVNATARGRAIAKKHIFLGGEDEPSYATNFHSGLRASGYLVVRVNAGEASVDRENALASTDELDLVGIAKTLTSCRARLVEDHGAILGGALVQMRDLTRARRALVRQKSAASNRIHVLVDRLLPGFLDDSKSGVGKIGGKWPSLGRSGGTPRASGWV